MRNFWNDSVNLTKMELGYCKKHWFALVMTYLILSFGTLAFICREPIKEIIVEKFRKSKKEKP